MTGFVQMGHTLVLQPMLKEANNHVQVYINIMFRVLVVGVATIEFGDDPFSCRANF